MTHNTVPWSLSYFIRLFGFCLSSLSGIQTVMRVWQRDTLILGVTSTAGLLDSWSYFRLSHVFIANMTGNTLIFGYSATTGNWSRSELSGLAIAFYVAGVFIGGWLSRPIRVEAKQAPPDAVLWPGRVQTLLLLESVLVFVASGIEAVIMPHQGSPTARALVCMGAVAMGLQSAAMLALHLPGMITTYVSGTWTILADGWAQLLDGEENDKRSAWEKRLLMQTGLLAAYCGAAAFLGWVDHTYPRAALGWIPALMLALVLAAGFTWRQLGQRTRDRTGPPHISSEPPL